MDTRAFADLFTYSQSNEHLYFTISPETFITDLCHGSINGYEINSFLQNNSDYLTSFKFIPIDVKKFISDETLHSASVILGKDTLAYTDYYEIYPSFWNPLLKVFEITISRHFNNFLDFAPYTKYHLYFPYFGLMELDNDVILDHKLIGYVSLDVYSGTLTLWVVRDSDNRTIIHENVKISIDLPVGKTNAEEMKRNNILQSIKLMGSAITIGVGAYTGNPIALGGGITTATNGITTALSNNVNRVTSYKGSSGIRNDVLCSKTPIIWMELPQNIHYPDLHLKGKPCNQNLPLSSVTGYTEIGEIHFEPNGYDIYDDEISEIQELLQLGVIL